MPAVPADANIEMGAYDAECGQYRSVLHDAWMHHNPQWEAYYPAFAWQIALESSCQRDAESASGAIGLAQLLGSAATDCRGAGLTGSRREAVFSAECAAWLQARAGRTWRSYRTSECRIVLVWVSYLTGAGWLIDAQDAARRDGRLAVCWDDGIGDYLQAVITPENAAHAHWYARWISDHSGIAVEMTHYAERAPTEQ